ncbi:YHS domain-containing protein, partial [Candidatus Neomarinimicrobiota bacterium]
MKMIDRKLHDPMCGMSIFPENAVGIMNWEGITYGFCSHHCLQRFSSDPARFAAEAIQKYPHLFGADSESAQDQGNSHVPMDKNPEVQVFMDPVCGMSVDPDKAGATLEHEGTTYHFCCHHCAEKFKSDPGKYLADDAIHEPMGHEAAQNEGTTYICPMDPEVQETKPGPCPKCGMALEPKTPIPATAV